MVSAETVPQVVKVVQDTGRSWQAGHNTFWKGNSGGITSPSASSCRTRRARPSQISSSTVCWICSIEYERPIQQSRRMESSAIWTCCWRTVAIPVGPGLSGFDFDWPCWRNAGSA